MKFLALALIHVYKFCISPFLGPRCRFYPSCSSYGLECFMKFSFFKALYLTILRILKCHPLCDGGYDPVPEEFSFSKEMRSLETKEKHYEC